MRGKRGSGGKQNVVRLSVFVLTVVTLCLLVPFYRRRLSRLRGIKEEEQWDEVDGVRGAKRVSGESDDFSNENYMRASADESDSKRIDNSQTIDNSTFASQLLKLLSVPVPILLSKSALKSKSIFSCGGSHVVKLKSYKDVRNLRHVEEVLPQYDMFYASRDDKIFANCAVVGNSGSMLEAERGLEIDDHDMVIRFNAGITEGYEQFVGTKTTFRIMNNPSSKAKQKGEITISTLRDDDIRDWANEVLAHPERAQSALATDPEFLCYAWQFVRNSGHKPSTGLVGVVLALKVCRKLSLYGFQASNYFKDTSRPHYYDWERPAKGRERVHPFAHEVALYTQLASHGFIQMIN